MRNDGFTPSRHQQAIFDFILSGRGSAAVNAVAGAGKTTTIVRAASLLADPSEALFVAFNVHVKETLARRLPAGMACSTIHGLGFRTLTAALGKLGNPDTRKYRQIVDGGVFGAAAAIYGDMPTAEDIRDTRDTLVKLAELVRLTLVDPLDADALTALAEHHGLETVRRGSAPRWGAQLKGVLEEGRRKATTERVIDFTDMVWLPVVLRLRPDTYSVVFVDEAQDLNACQAALVLSSLRPGGRLVAVGDPRQAIYGFAGADYAAFEKLREAASAVELPLSVCYRCPARVVEMARGIVPSIEPAPGAPEGVVTTLRQEDVYTAARPGDLILSRRTSVLMKTCLAFLAKGRPAKVRGKEIGKQLAAWIDEASRLRGATFSRLSMLLDLVAEKKTRRALGARDEEARLAAIADQREALGACQAWINARSFDQFKAALEGLFADAGNVVWLSTIHRAKGLESDRVFILEFDRLPMSFRKQSPEQAAQELNLKYVAITRALRELYLVLSNEASERRREAA